MGDSKMDVIAIYLLIGLLLSFLVIFTIDTNSAESKCLARIMADAIIIAWPVLVPLYLFFDLKAK